ncbi:copper homeostasis protein [Singulisphaera sp. GP187]|uniref:copper homeostasis protein CutC n=1 Tax=Singulisphaera sp. GP187 TaxID=1882752 RepID=UPI0009262E90|nr:copper homeostasis protein CutC [Singulisphaera sp. GP187]SIN95324.1 copper homeostasis protein [Singulisphaera sp. GP187]
MNIVVEICVQGIESALAAQAGGADRIELCEDLAVGGVTPSAGTIAVACRRLAIPVHVLIRPRGGNFVYSEAEFEVMERDIAMVKSLGVAGVVIGLLRPDRSLDQDRLARLVVASRPLNVTFHRAFDEVTNPFDVVDELIGLGVERILTSGGAVRAADGLVRLAESTQRARGRIAIAAGGRITEADLPAILGAGLKEFHIGSAACSGGMVLADKVRRLVEVARGLRISYRDISK